MDKNDKELLNDFKEYLKESKKFREITKKYIDEHTKFSKYSDTIQEKLRKRTKELERKETL